MALSFFCRVGVVDRHPEQLKEEQAPIFERETASLACARAPLCSVVCGRVGGLSQLSGATRCSFKRQPAALEPAIIGKLLPTPRSRTSVEPLAARLARSFAFRGEHATSACATTCSPPVRAVRREDRRPTACCRDRGRAAAVVAAVGARSSAAPHAPHCADAPTHTRALPLSLSLSPHYIASQSARARRSQ